MVVERIVLGAHHVVIAVHVVEREHAVSTRLEAHQREFTATVCARNAFQRQACECGIIEALAVGAHEYMLHRLEVTRPQHDARDAHRVNLVACREGESISVQRVPLVVVFDAIREVDSVGGVGLHLVSELDNHLFTQRLDGGLVFLHGRHRHLLHLVFDVDNLVEGYLHLVALDVACALGRCTLHHVRGCIVTRATLRRADIGTSGEE